MNGKKVVITRASQQADELGTLLYQHGAQPLLYPCIAIAPPEKLSWLDAGLQAAATREFDWLVLTSANAVPVLVQRLQALAIPTQRLAYLKVACVGPATAAAVTNQLGLTVQTVPETYVAEALAATFKHRQSARILLLQADIARPVLAQELTRLGALVCSLPAYRTVQGSGGVTLPDLLARQQVDAITFTSASTVTHCLARLEAEGGNPALLADVCLACIGPVTAQALQERGFSVDVSPAEHTLEGLVAGLATYFQIQEQAEEGKASQRKDR